MYEHYACGGIDGKTISEINAIRPSSAFDNNPVSPFGLDGIRPSQPFAYPAVGSQTPIEEKDYVLLVHGWRMRPQEKTDFGNTAFKRLWHRGYRGRFGAFDWPTEWTNTNGTTGQLGPGGIAWDPRNFDRSERKAYLSAAALRQLLKQLTLKHPGKVRLMAHSMGNVVSSEALRLEARDPQPQALVHSYSACQAAMAAYAYDASGPQRLNAGYINGNAAISGALQFVQFSSGWEDSDIPEVYGHHSPTNGAAYFTGIKAVASNKIINFHNRDDYALGLWLANQWQKPDVTYNYTDKWFDGTTQKIFWRQDFGGYQALQLFYDTYEIFAHAAEAKSPPLGSAVGDGHTVSGQITESVDCHRFNASDSTDPRNFKEKSEDHSAEFLGVAMQRWLFWQEFLEKTEITKFIPR